jgi:hypothetical protein
MDTVNRYRNVIERVLGAHTKIPSSISEVELQTVFDQINDHYLLVQVGWGKQKRIYGTLAHVDVVGAKVWIQHDGT